MEVVSKGCEACKIGFEVIIGQEFLWNYCPSCAKPLQLEAEGIEIEYSTITPIDT